MKGVILVKYTMATEESIGVAMTELQQQRMQVCETTGYKNSKSNEGRQAKNGGVKEETEVQRSLTERLVRSRLLWAGHVEMMADDRLLKRAAELREQG